jgi:hypothetical protein
VAGELELLPSELDKGEYRLRPENGGFGPGFWLAYSD